MSLINTIRKIKQINIESPMPEPTFAEVYTEDSKIYINTNGCFKIVEIFYTGSAYITKGKRFTLRLQLNGNKITIINILGRLTGFTKRGVGILCNYGGFLNIEDCTVITHENRKIKASITKKTDELNFENSKTKVEDEDFVIYYEEEEKIGNKIISPMQRGVGRTVLPPSSINRDGKLQMPEKSTSSATEIPKYLGKDTKEITQKYSKTLVKTKAVLTKIKPTKIKPTKGGY